MSTCCSGVRRKNRRRSSGNRWIASRVQALERRSRRPSTLIDAVHTLPRSTFPTFAALGVKAKRADTGRFGHTVEPVCFCAIWRPSLRRERISRSARRSSRAQFVDSPFARPGRRVPAKRAACQRALGRRCRMESPRRWIAAAQAAPRRTQTMGSERARARRLWRARNSL
jgi:hypothetical protein